MYIARQISEILQSKESLAFPSAAIKHLLTDSRKLGQKEGVLFFAITGDRLNGHEYISNLYEQGVMNFVVEEGFETKKYPKANFFVVKNSIVALQKLAADHRQQFSFPIIGITGSNGKTIVKEWCHQLLQTDYNVVRSPKSYNSQIGVPLSVWNINNQNNLGIFEAGISESDEMQKLEKIIAPSIGIFTNIGAAHSQNFIGDAHKIKEKLCLFISSEILIYCKDHNLVNQCISSLWANAGKDDIKGPSLFTWSEKDTQADVFVSQKKIESTTTELELVYKEQVFQLTIPFSDASSIENALHCITLLCYLGKSIAYIQNQLSKLQRVAMRLDQKQGINDCTIINDSYNSDIDSLKIALDFLKQQQRFDKKTVILSDILQSGLSGIDLYTSVAQLLENAKIDKFIGIGTSINHHKYLFEKIEEVQYFATTQEFLENITDDDFQEEAILLKGARKFYFERISALLEEKAHATVLEVNMNALAHNLHVHTKKLQKGTKIMAMVKAFSYGAGTHEIAKILEFNRVDYLGVAYADEGVSLRKAGIKLPIMVLNPEKRSFETMISYRLEPEIYSFSTLNHFLEVLEIAQLKEPYPIHINIDTGMRRMGFEETDLTLLSNQLKNTDKVLVKSIFSHLAASDEEDCDDFTNAQIEKFDFLSQELSRHLAKKPMRHLANSHGIVRFPKSHFDMVRLGIGLYGFGASPELENVSTLKTVISQIKEIKQGETIGYSRKAVAKIDMKIATIAIGYADGLNRLLSNGNGNVFLQGKKVPIVGNICMDMCMVDITNIPSAQEGDRVEIFGENIHVDEIAQQMNTIPYEVLTNISERVKRVFYVE